MQSQRELGSAEGPRYWSLAGLFLGALSALKGARVPSLWAATQAQFDYSSGFVKRGLFGQLLHVLHLPTEHYWVFAGVSLVILLAFVATFLAYLRRSGHQRCFDDGIIAAAFLSSFAVSYFFHLIGYLDIPLAMFALLALSFSRTPIVVLLAALLGILIHELYAIVFLPVTLLPLVLDAVEAKDFSVRRRQLLWVLGIIALVFVEVLVVSLRRPLTPQQLEALIAQIQLRVDFPLREDFFEVFRRSAAANFKIQLQLAMHPGWWAHHVLSIAAFMPTTMLLLWVSYRAIATRFGAGTRTMLTAAVALATFAPLAMCAFAWDIYRWYTLVAFDAFLVSTVIAKRWTADGYPPLAASLTRRKVTLLVIFLNLATGTGLFDNYLSNTFPYRESLPFFYKTIHGHPPMPVH